jgi:hypothetical protein
MKKVLLLSFFLIVLTFSGCTHFTSDPDALPTVSSERFIKMPQRTGMSVENSFFAVKLVVGAIGANIGLNVGYTGPNGPVHIDANLDMTARSFLGIKLITYIVNDEYAAIDFFPSLTFNRPNYLDLTFTGLDLTGVDPEHVDFYYLDGEGNLHPVEYSNKVVDIPNGILKVEGVKLTHFSRYIWGK